MRTQLCVFLGRDADVKEAIRNAEDDANYYLAHCKEPEVVQMNTTLNIISSECFAVYTVSMAIRAKSFADDPKVTA